MVRALDKADVMLTLSTAL